jgi:hypothetical protein
VEAQVEIAVRPVRGLDARSVGRIGVTLAREAHVDAGEPLAEPRAQVVREAKRQVLLAQSRLRDVAGVGTAVAGIEDEDAQRAVRGGAVLGREGNVARRHVGRELDLDEQLALRHLHAIALRGRGERQLDEHASGLAAEAHGREKALPGQRVAGHGGEHAARDLDEEATAPRREHRRLERNGERQREPRARPLHREHRRAQVRIAREQREALALGIPCGARDEAAREREREDLDRHVHLAGDESRGRGQPDRRVVDDDVGRVYGDAHPVADVSDLELLQVRDPVLGRVDEAREVVRADVDAAVELHRAHGLGRAAADALDAHVGARGPGCGDRGGGDDDGDGEEARGGRERGTSHSPLPRLRIARRTSRSDSRCAIVWRLSYAFLPRHTPIATFALPRVK